jgi:hypothetical protein
MSAPAAVALLETYHVSPQNLAQAPYVQPTLPPCVRGVVVRNNSAATLAVRVGTGSGGTGAVALTVYPWSWLSVGVEARRLAVALAPGTSAPSQGDVTLAVTDQALPWDEGLMRGTAALTYRDPSSGSYTTVGHVAFARPSAEVMVWNDDSANALTIAFDGQAAGVGPLTVKPGAFVELAVAVTGITAGGTSTAWRLEVWS